MDIEKLPHEIYGGAWKSGHVQGIAVDTKREYIYYSFTTRLVKTDMKGNVAGTVEGLIGHLGCIDFCDDDGCVYGSLELKHDSIGKGIMEKTGKQIASEDSFCVAIFDPEKITRVGMDAEKDGIMKAVYMPEVVSDYSAKIKTGKGEYEHRHGCSGIDGTGFGCVPGSGKGSEKSYSCIRYLRRRRA